MNKKKNDDSSNNIKLNQKKSSKNIINSRAKHNNNEGQDIIKNILEANKIISKEEYHENINSENENETKMNLLTNEYRQPGNFKFINIIKTLKVFNQNILEPNDNHDNYRMIINIIVDDDSLNSTNNLLTIIKSIESSLNSLKEINLNIRRILLCIFFRHFTYEACFKYLFPGLKFYNHIKSHEHNFNCSYGQYSSGNNINILLFYKKSSSFIEIYKYFYNHLLPSLFNFKTKEKNKTVLIVNWPNGKIIANEIIKNNGHMGCMPGQYILRNVIKICRNRNMVLIPEINFVPHKADKIAGFVNKYCLNNDKTKINLYWYIICGYPIDHRFFFINMNYQLFNTIKLFYQKIIKVNSEEYYHDYYLTIYLRKHMKKIEIQKISDIKVEYSDLPWNLKIYFHDLILRRGSENANFINLLKYFFSCKKCSFILIIQKIFLFFKLINDFLHFFWLGISFLICYALFNDTFGNEGNNKMDYFCSLGYVIMSIILFSISLLHIRNKPKIKHSKIIRYMQLKYEGYTIILILYIIHYIYFFFIIICILFALIHIKQGKYFDIKDREYYVLNTRLVIIILFSNIFIYFLPSFFRISNIVSKDFIYYLFLYLPCAPTFFHYPSMLTCTKTINSKKKKIESLYIGLYIALNGFLTVFCLLFDTTRQRRMNFLSIMGLIITVLNGIKLIVSIIGTCLIKRFKHNYEKYIKDVNWKIEDEIITKEKNEKSEECKRNINNIKIDLNLANGKIRDINEIKEIEDKEEINKENEDNENDIDNNNIKEFNSNIKKSNLSEKNINGKNHNLSEEKIIQSMEANFEKVYSNINIDKYPMDTIENNTEIKTNENEINNGYNNLKDSIRPILDEKAESNGLDIYPHDNTQSFSVQNTSINRISGAINEEDLEENCA